MYQETKLTRHVEGLECRKSHYTNWIEALEACLSHQLKTHAPELQLLTHAVTILATHGWGRSENVSFGHTALNSVCHRFCIPLEKAGIDSALVLEEWGDMVEYAK